jgi:hypothetical protein
MTMAESAAAPVRLGKNAIPLAAAMLTRAFFLWVIVWRGHAIATNTGVSAMRTMIKPLKCLVPE